MRKGQRRPQRRSQSRGWGNCWTLALPLWGRNPKFTYLIIRHTRAAKQSVWHVMFAESIAGVRVTETKPLRRVSGWPWWRILLFSIFFHYRVRTGVGEEVGFWPSERMFSNPRRTKRYERREHYVKYLIRKKHK